MSDWYILDENYNPVKASVEDWNEWDRRRGSDPDIHFKFEKVVGAIEFYVSTNFLGLDHRYDDLVPVLWESMAFVDTFGRNSKTMGKELCQIRYSTYVDAKAGHERLIRIVEALCGDDDGEQIKKTMCELFGDRLD